MSTIQRRDYVYAVFERQCEIALRNLEKIHAAVGERVTVGVCDGHRLWGAKLGPFFSPRDLPPTVQAFHANSMTGSTRTRTGKFHSFMRAHLASLWTISWMLALTA